MLVRVNASELKSVFQDIRPIFKGVQDGALMGFTLEDHVLYITVQSNVVYEQQLASEEAGPYSLTVLYQDLYELLPGRGVAELELTSTFIGISTPVMRTVLKPAHGCITRYKRRAAKAVDIAPSIFSNWLSVFTETTIVAKTLQREASIVFKPPFAIIKYPTVWVQAPNQYLDTTMGLRELKALTTFEPSSFGMADDVIEFFRGSALMAVARTDAGQCKAIDDVIVPEATAVMQGGSYLLRVQQLMRSVGAGPCVCLLYTDGAQLAVSRPKVQTNLTIGACTKPIITIPTFIEYIQMLFKLFGESPVTVTTGKGMVKLQVGNASILLSVI